MAESVSSDGIIEVCLDTSEGARGGMLVSARGASGTSGEEQWVRPSREVLSELVEDEEEDRREEQMEDVEV